LKEQGKRQDQQVEHRRILGVDSNLVLIAPEQACRGKGAETVPQRVALKKAFRIADEPLPVERPDHLPANGPIKMPTLFIAARKAGRRTALVSGKEKFNTLRDTAEMDVFVGGARTEADVAEQAVAQLYAGADLVFVHLPDSTGGEPWLFLSEGKADPDYQEGVAARKPVSLAFQAETHSSGGETGDANPEIASASAPFGGE
jgi:hypothetical protein